MVIAIVALVALVLGGLLFLWLRWRAEQSGALAANAVTIAATAALKTAADDLKRARDALAKQNDLEAKTDAKTVEARPELDAAIARINNLRV